jgi:hypothetical protein
VQIDASVAVIVVIFGVTFLVLRSFLFKPVLGILEERKAEASSARAIWEETRAVTAGELDAQRALLSDARKSEERHSWLGSRRWPTPSARRRLGWPRPRPSWSGRSPSRRRPSSSELAASASR